MSAMPTALYYVNNAVGTADITNRGFHPTESTKKMAIETRWPFFVLLLTSQFNLLQLSVESYMLPIKPDSVR